MSRSGGQEQKTNPEESTWVKGRKMSSSQGFTEERKEKGMGGGNSWDWNSHYYNHNTR